MPSDPPQSLQSLQLKTCLVKWQRSGEVAPIGGSVVAVVVAATMVVVKTGGTSPKTKTPETRTKAPKTKVVVVAPTEEGAVVDSQAQSKVPNTLMGLQMAPARSIILLAVLQLSVEDH